MNTNNLRMDLFFIRDFDYYLLYTCVVADLHARAVTLAREEDEEPRRVGIERTAVAGFEKLDILRRVIRHNLLPCRIGRSQVDALATLGHILYVYILAVSLEKGRVLGRII